MLPKKLHQEQLDRFFKAFDDLNKKIEIDKTYSSKNYELYLTYFTLTQKIWPILDDATEKIKDELDSLKL